MGNTEAKSRFQEFFPEPGVKQSVKVLKLLSEGSRLRILLYLAKEGPCPVTEIVEALDLVQSTCSHHLFLLRTADNVRLSEREIHSARKSRSLSG